MSGYGKRRGHKDRKSYNYYNEHMTFGQLLDKACAETKIVDKEKEEINNYYENVFESKHNKNENQGYNYSNKNYNKTNYNKPGKFENYDNSGKNSQKHEKKNFNNQLNFFSQNRNFYTDSNNKFTNEQDEYSKYDDNSTYYYEEKGKNIKNQGNRQYRKNEKNYNHHDNYEEKYHNYSKGNNYNNSNNKKPDIKKDSILIDVEKNQNNQRENNNFHPDFPHYNPEFKRVQMKILDNEIKEEEKENEQQIFQEKIELREAEKQPGIEKASDLFNKQRNLTRGKIQEQNILQKILIGNEKVMQTPDIISNIIDIINSPKNDEEIQEEFIDLLGYDDLDFISQLIQNRKEINEVINVVKVFITENEKNEKLRQSQNIHSLATVGISIEQIENKKRSFQQGQNINEQIEKKKNTNLKILEQIGFTSKFVKENQMLGLHEKKIYPLKIEKEQFSSDNIIKFGQGSSQSSQNHYLTEKKNYTSHIEIRVKPVLMERPKTDLVNVADLPEWAHKAFNFKSFNEIQSTVFSKAFKSEENLLICAPTGAGKTNIALLSILREVSRNLSDLNSEGKETKDFKNIEWKFKIVYLVPLKALANEIVDKFKTSLAFLNINVSEFSADVNLSKDQIEQTNLFVAIPEKWDLFTRKNDQVFSSLKLMIIDEVHLLNEDRGRVLESIVARTVRKAEINQKFIRIAGLSATLPNYWDIAEFLCVKEGLFNFDSSYRSTPLKMKFLGVSETKKTDRDLKEVENDITYREIVRYLEKGKQVLIFVHSRAETINFAKEIIKKSQEYQETEYFQCGNPSKLRHIKFQNKNLDELTQWGIGFHNAGLLRKDRNHVENLFANKALNVLVSTSTLAWGVNLPAYCVIIKGVQYYDASKCSMVDMGILDIQQMFGRAGRPQFDKKGVAQIICSSSKIDYYVNLLKNQIEIESKLPKFLSDAINAEIAIGNIHNIAEAVSWLKLTYFSIRLRKNPYAYNLMLKEIKNIPQDELLKEIATKSLETLNKFKLIRYLRSNATVHSTELGRIASKYYMSYMSIAEFYEKLNDNMYDYELLQLFSKTEEFSNMRIMQEENNELELLKAKFDIFKSKEYDELELCKPIILLQTHLKGGYEFKNSSLHMDSIYIMDNSSRIMRAILEISLHKHLVKTTFLILNYVKLIERRMFPGNTPLWQFTYESNSSVGNKQNKFESREGFLSSEICKRIDSNNLSNISELLDEDNLVLSKQLNYPKERIYEIKKYAEFLPNFKYDVIVKPITRTIMNITITLMPNFNWKKRWNKFSEPFWVIVDNGNEIIHYEYLLITNKNSVNESKKIKNKETIITFAVPFEINPGEKQADIEKYYNINILSDRWVGVEFTEYIHLNEIDVPQDQNVHTPLLDLFPLPKSALKNIRYEKIFNFTHFNPVQTQVFHSCYNSDVNILCGAPTGSGKTVVAELAILRCFNENPNNKVIYIAPLKSLAKERLRDWEIKMDKINKKIIELTGDFTPDLKQLLEADILITTPEKWDGISRNWHHRVYVQKVSLVIIDEIHLLGLDRGPILEVIVSRMRFISEKTKSKVRFVGLSTALANSYDVAAWLGINTNYDNKKPPGLFNFKPAVRPCPVTVHIEGFSEPHYCPRMGTMNKPAYNAIKDFSINKPVLIFVSSRRQTRLTALDLISFCASDSQHHSFLNISIEEMKTIIECVKDENLKHTLNFGIGMHHAGLIESDRRIVEDLFYNSSIQILVATSTVAWGVNFPAHLVIIKGTEYYDPKLKSYVDMPITDVLQMIGRAGRPQYDDSAVACLFVSQDKKNFYKKFLYEPFPLESNLHKMLEDHLNAEISVGTLVSKQACIEYLSWTYFFRRLLKNPSYYGLEKIDSKSVNEYLSKLIDKILNNLSEAKTITINSDETLSSNFLGNLSAFYYVSYKTAHSFYMTIKPGLEIINLIEILSDAQEYEELPVRHNEEDLNEILAKVCPFEVDLNNLDSPHVKTNLLLQAHLSRLPLPISDYTTDSKLVTENCIRFLLFMIDLSSEKNFLDTTINLILLLQMVNQGLWISDSSLLSLPYFNEEHIYKLGYEAGIQHLPELIHIKENINDLFDACKINLGISEKKHIKSILDKIPEIKIDFKCHTLDSKTLERTYGSKIFLTFLNFI